MINAYQQKIKMMLKSKKVKNLSNILSMRMTVIIVAVLCVGFVSFPLVNADRYQEQIDNLRSQNSEAEKKVDELEVQASTLEGVIAELQGRINGLEQQIRKNQAVSDDLKQQIVVAEAELAKQKDLLGQNIKAMYMEGQISTIEMLATSKDLSQFVDKQQYREVVESRIKAQVDKITDLKLQLKTQRERIEQLIKEDTILRQNIATQKAEQDRLLGLNQSERNNYNQSIQNNNKEITELRRLQYLENVRLFGGGGGVVGGGGYPWGNAPCLGTGQVAGWCPGYEWGYNGSYNNWATGGYAFRNCTDWVAYRVNSTGRHVPSGLGNANSWDNRAPSYGFTVSSTPREGAAAVSNSGYYGHVMYVESVNSDGTITISDYNRAGPGEYGVKSISPSGLSFVYF